MCVTPESMMARGAKRRVCVPIYRVVFMCTYTHIHIYVCVYMYVTPASMMARGAKRRVVSTLAADLAAVLTPVLVPVLANT